MSRTTYQVGSAPFEKMRSAVDLLKESGWSVRQIATKAGANNPTMLYLALGNKSNINAEFADAIIAMGEKVENGETVRRPYKRDTQTTKTKKRRRRVARTTNGSNHSYNHTGTIEQLSATLETISAGLTQLQSLVPDLTRLAQVDGVLQQLKGAGLN